MKHEFYLFVAHGFHFSTKSIKSAQIALHHDIRQTFNDIVLYNLNKKAKGNNRVKKCKLEKMPNVIFCRYECTEIGIK